VKAVHRGELAVAVHRGELAVAEAAPAKQKKFLLGRLAMLGVVLAMYLAVQTTSDQGSLLTPATTVAVIVDARPIYMPLWAARADYEQLVRLDHPTRQQIKRLAALKLAIGTLEALEACRQRIEPSCRVLPTGYRQRP